MKNKVKVVSQSVGLVMAFFLVQVMVSVVIGIYYGVKSGINGETLNPNVVTQAAQSQWAIIAMQVLGGLFLLLVFKLRKRKVFDYLSVKKVSIQEIFMYISYGIGFQFITILVNNTISQFYSLEKSAQSVNGLLFTNNIVLSLLIVLILAPLTEELLFRGMVLNKLNNHLSTKAALVIQGLLFSAIHFNLAQTLPTFLLGLFLGYTYLKFKNILAPLVIHVSFNLFALVLNYIPENLLFFSLIIPVIAGLIAIDLTQKYHGSGPVSSSKVPSVD